MVIAAALLQQIVYIRLHVLYISEIAIHHGAHECKLYQRPLCGNVIVVPHLVEILFHLVDIVIENINIEIFQSHIPAHFFHTTVVVEAAALKQLVPLLYQAHRFFYIAHIESRFGGCHICHLHIVAFLLLRQYGEKFFGQLISLIILTEKRIDIGIKHSHYGVNYFVVRFGGVVLEFLQFVPSVAHIAVPVEHFHLVVFGEHPVVALTTGNPLHLGAVFAHHLYVVE